MYKMGEKIKLSISIMVSNSIDTIEKCMKSLEPILTKVPSELIIVDTGGTDGSIEIAREYADEVVPFEWCKDFAKARNAGLEKAQGEWFLFMDDDEWFEDAGEIVEFFNSGEYLQYKCATYLIRNYSNAEGTKWHDIRSYRMTKIQEDTKFVCPIHEMLSPLHFPEKVLSCYLHHYGYVYKNETDLRKHGLRNISLIQEVLEKEPDNYRLWVQLAQEYRAINEIQLSEDVSIKTIEKAVGGKQLNREDKKMLGWLLQNVVGMEMIKLDYTKAYHYAKEYFTYNWINCITCTNLAYRLAALCFELEKYDECVRYITVYEQTYQALKDDLQLRREEVVLEQEEVIEECRLAECYVLGIRASVRLGKRGDADSYAEKLVLLEPYDRSQEEIEGLFQYLLRGVQEEKSKKIVEYLFQKEQVRQVMAAVIDRDSWEENERQQLIQLLASNKTEEQYSLPYQIIRNFQTGEREELKKDIDIYISHKENMLETMGPLWEVIDSLGMDIGHYMSSQEVSKWVMQVNTFVVFASEKKIDILLRVLEKVQEESFQTSTLKMRCIEKKMRLDTVDQCTYEELEWLGKEYVELVFWVFQRLYHPDSFYNEFLTLLPKECRFARKLEDVLTGSLEELEIAKEMKTATDIYPEMAAYCKNFILKRREHLDRKSQQSDEFMRLAEQIKLKIRDFIKLGSYDLAAQTLSQLAVLVPDDWEIVILKETIDEARKE